MAGTSDHYTVLGVAPGATAEEISVAFGQRAQRIPRDQRDPARNPAYRELVVAYQALAGEASAATPDRTRTSGGKPSLLQVEMLASHNVLPAIQEPQLLYLLLSIGAIPVVFAKRAPVNLCLVVDRSTSMRGSRITQVKTAAGLVVHQLQPHDWFSFVAFSDRAEVVVPAGPVERKKAIKSKISQVYTSGGTEMLQGLGLGITELHKGARSSRMSHLVLLTDGHTYGDEQACVEVARRAADHGIGISALGIGHEWNDTFLDALVAPSGGSSAYFESTEQVLGYLEQRVSALNRAVAREVQLQLDLPAGMHLRSANKLSPSSQPVDYSLDRMPLGTVQHSVPLSVLFELGVQPSASGSSVRLRADISATIVPTGQRDQHFFGQVEIGFAQDPPPRPPLPAVARAVHKLSLHLMSEKVNEDLETGSVREATRRLEILATRLRSVGEIQLAATAEREADNISREGEVSAAGRKKLKYGTRALVSDDSLS
jgi:Ca-activated chloride channel family protein